MTAPVWQDSHGALWQGHVLDVLAAMEPESVQCVVTSPPYWGLRSYNTDPQLWGNHNGCAHDLAAAPGKVLTGGTGEASGKQLTNAGSQYGNDWATVHPAGYRASDTHPGPLQHAGNTGRENRSGAVCQHCQAFYGELGSEPTPAMFVEHLVEVFRGVWRVLRDDGTCWINLGDSYAANRTYQVTDNKSVDVGNTGGMRVPPGLKSKDLCLLPERLAIALQDDGWYVRSRIAWCKSSAMPESVQDRPTGAWEHIWLLAKARHYFYDADAVRQPALLTGGGTVPTPDKAARAGLTSNGTGATTLRSKDIAGANLRNYWVLGPEPLREQHYAAFPSEIPRRAILAGTSERGACATCGAPWARVVERTGVDNASNEVVPDYDVPGLSKGSSADRVRRLSGATYQRVVAATDHWTPTCQCGTDETRPCVVLDPFNGSGTSMVVARALGRYAVGVELNPAYCAMAMKRLRQHVLL